MFVLGKLLIFSTHRTTDSGDMGGLLHDLGLKRSRGLIT